MFLIVLSGGSKLNLDCAAMFAAVQHGLGEMRRIWGSCRLPRRGRRVGRHGPSRPLVVMIGRSKLYGPVRSYPVGINSKFFVVVGAKVD